MNGGAMNGVMNDSVDSNSTNSSNSRAEAEAKDTDDPSLVQRPNPLGCSGSSEEGGVVVVVVDKYFSHLTISIWPLDRVIKLPCPRPLIPTI